MAELHSYCLVARVRMLIRERKIAPETVRLLFLSGRKPEFAYVN